MLIFIGFNNPFTVRIDLLNFIYYRMIGNTTTKISVFKISKTLIFQPPLGRIKTLSKLDIIPLLSKSPLNIKAYFHSRHFVMVNEFECVPWKINSGR